MKKIKDFIYSTSDIMVSLLIVICVVFFVGRELKPWFPQGSSFLLSLFFGQELPSSPDNSLSEAKRILEEQQAATAKEEEHAGSKEVKTSFEAQKQEEEREYIKISSPNPDSPTINFVIKEDSSNEKVVSDLLALRLIHDAQAFLQAMEEAEPPKKFKAGRFRIPKNMPEEELLELLTVQ